MLRLTWQFLLTEVLNLCRFAGASVESAQKRQLKPILHQNCCPAENCECNTVRPDKEQHRDVSVKADSHRAQVFFRIVSTEILKNWYGILWMQNIWMGKNIYSEGHWFQMIISCENMFDQWNHLFQLMSYLHVLCCPPFTSDAVSQSWEWHHTWVGGVLVQVRKPRSCPAIHCKSEVDYSNSVFPTSDLNASQCICSGNLEHPQQTDIGMASLQPLPASNGP